MTPRAPALALLAAAALAGCSRDPATPAATPAPGPAGAAAPAPAPEDPALTQFQPEDPEVARRRAERDEALGRFHSLRDAFTHGGRAAPAAAARLDAALRAVPAHPAVRWSVSCRGRACRVRADRPPESWRALLLADRGVQAVADRIAADPDGVDPAAYVLLAEVDAAPGDDLLATLERELSASPEARACAQDASATGTVVYELRVDGSGFTYRADGDLPWPVLSCVNGVLGDLMRGIDVPPSAKSATRTVALRL